jgi:hypothetical protein
MASGEILTNKRERKKILENTYCQCTGWYSEESHRRLYHYICAESEETVMVSM